MHGSPRHLAVHVNIRDGEKKHIDSYNSLK
jgi:hypothetical protein